MSANKISKVRTVDELTHLVDKKIKAKYVFFWGHRKRKDGKVDKSCFSQWFPAPFTVDGENYGSAEHIMMAEKARLFGDSLMRDRILAAKSPAEAKKLGRMVSGFDKSIWIDHRFEIVVTANLAKFRQHPEFKEFLLNTGNKVLVEASPVDRIWGIGLAADDEKIRNPRTWNGLNLLGFALMDVRDKLRVTK